MFTQQNVPVVSSNLETLSHSLLLLVTYRYDHRFTMYANNKMNDCRGKSHTIVYEMYKSLLTGALSSMYLSQ